VLAYSLLNTPPPAVRGAASLGECLRGGVRVRECVGVGVVVYWWCSSFDSVIQLLLHWQQHTRVMTTQAQALYNLLT